MPDPPLKLAMPPLFRLRVGVPPLTTTTSENLTSIVTLSPARSEPSFAP